MSRGVLAPGIRCALLTLVVLLAAAPAGAQVIQKDLPDQLKGLELKQKLGEQVPLDLQFTDSTGKKVALGSYFKPGKPVVLALVYYNCPMMCPLTLSRIQDRLNAISYTAGEDFNVVIISFDPLNTTKMAAEAKETYLGGYTKRTPASDAGWTFHTSDPVSVKKLADGVGFPFRFMEESGQYAHPAVLTILTPEGRVSGYLDGLGSDGGELRLALLQASEGKIAKGIADFFLHRCYRFDSSTGKYTIQAFRVMQLGGLITAMAIATLLVALRAGERARKMRLEKLAARGPHAPGHAALPHPSMGSTA